MALCAPPLSLPSAGRRLPAPRDRCHTPSAVRRSRQCIRQHRGSQAQVPRLHLQLLPPAQLLCPPRVRPVRLPRTVVAPPDPLLLPRHSPRHRTRLGRFLPARLPPRRTRRPARRPHHRHSRLAGPQGPARPRPLPRTLPLLLRRPGPPSSAKWMLAASSARIRPPSRHRPTRPAPTPHWRPPLRCSAACWTRSSGVCLRVWLPCCAAAAATAAAPPLLGLHRKTVAKGRRQLATGDVEPDRVRKPGGGRKSLQKETPWMIDKLVELVTQETAGDPMGGLLWTYRSLPKRPLLANRELLASRKGTVIPDRALRSDCCVARQEQTASGMSMVANQSRATRWCWCSERTRASQTLL